MSGSKTEITVLHDRRNVSIKDGVKKVDEEFIIQGEKGLKIKYYNKLNDSINKIVITGKDDKYKMKTYKDKESAVEKELTKKELMAELKSNSLLSFANSFSKELKGGENLELNGGAKKSGSKKSKSKKSGSKKSGSKKSGSKKSGSKKSSSKKSGSKKSYSKK